MKFVVTIVLMFAMTGQMFHGDFIVLDYLTHIQRYEALCINKDKPELHCNGQCQMDKKLAEAHKQKSTSPDGGQISPTTTFLYCSLDSLHFNWVECTNTLSASFEKVFALIKRAPDGIFHPPLYCA